MESSKLDRLFREKSNEYRPIPSDSSWEAISGQIQKKDNVWQTYWKAAAAVILVVGASWIFLKSSSFTEMKSIVADHPQYFELEAIIDIPVVQNQEETTQGVVQKSSQLLKPAITLSEVKTNQAFTAREWLSVEGRGLAIEFELVKVDRLKPENATPAISIKYYASAQPKEAEAKKGFGNLFARAQDLKPGQLFADLRAAKDDLFASRNR